MYSSGYKSINIGPLSQLSLFWVTITNQSNQAFDAAASCCMNTVHCSADTTTIHVDMDVISFEPVQSAPGGK